MENQKKESQFSGMTREEIIRQARKQILHSAVLALAALIVIGVACYAWFVSSKAVTAEVGKVSMRVEGFELASAAGEDGKGAYDKYGSHLDPALPEGETIPSQVEWTEQKTMTWTKRNQTIRWRVDENSNFANAGSRKGIRPGSSGTLSFYVIPNATGELTVKCSLSLLPKMKNDGSAETAAKLLRGHILFIYEYEYLDGEQTATKSGIAEVTDGSFTVYLPNAQANVPQLVTLNWFWPYLLRDAVNRADFGDTIKGWTEDPEQSKYFYYNGGSTLAEVSAKNRSRYYNNADQFIGDYVSAIVLELTADLA